MNTLMADNRGLTHQTVVAMEAHQLDTTTVVIGEMATAVAALEIPMAVDTAMEIQEDTIGNVFMVTLITPMVMVPTKLSP